MTDLTDTIKELREVADSYRKHQVCPDEIINVSLHELEALLDAAEKAEQWEQMCESVQQTNQSLIKKLSKFEKAQFNLCELSDLAEKAERYEKALRSVFDIADNVLNEEIMDLCSEALSPEHPEGDK